MRSATRAPQRPRKALKRPKAKTSSSASFRWSETFRVRVWGDGACFTRPENKVERYTYPVPTPSALRGLIEAIFWHPGVMFHVIRITLLKPLRLWTYRTNEIKHRANPVVPHINVEEDRDQRYTTALRDVEYIVEFRFRIGQGALDMDHDALRVKYADMLQRRLETGKCHHQPCFGMREFPAFFEPAPASWTVPQELVGTRDLGMVLLDRDYSIAGNPPRFFPAELRDGVVVEKGKDALPVMVYASEGGEA